MTGHGHLIAAREVVGTLRYQVVLLEAVVEHEDLGLVADLTEVRGDVLRSERVRTQPLATNEPAAATRPAAACSV